MVHQFARVLVSTLVLGLYAAPSVAQNIFAHPTNLKVLPDDTSPAQLRETMKGFSQALHVRCNHCHTAKDPNDLASYDFADDGKTEKMRARDMMRMVEAINTRLLPAADGKQPEIHVVCTTCHRGLPKPELMTDHLLRTIPADGFPNARTDYLALKDGHGSDGSYDFSEAPLLDAASRLWPDDSTNAEQLFAFAAEQFPASIRAYQTHAQALLQTGKADAAIAVLESGRGRGEANDAQIAQMIGNIKAQAPQ